MKKQVILFGLLAGVMSASSMFAAPSDPKPLNELLGLRQAPAFNSALAIPNPVQSKAVQEAATDGGIVINASVIYPSNVQGMWAYSTTSSNPQRLSIDPNIVATGGGIEANGKYYFNRYLEMMGFEEIKTFSYTTSDWTEYDAFTGKIEYVATTMAYNHLRDEVYGCFINETRTGYNFVRWNYDRYQPGPVIAPIERPWSGAAFSSDGTLYAIERNGDLYKVNISNGEMTLVGKTGVESTYLSDATIDIDTDIMYWSVCNDSEYALYSVDIKTAVANKLYDFDNEEQLCGMYVVKAAPVYNEAAPARISSVSANFSGTSLSGSISFSAPNYTVAQDRLDAEVELTYTVRANGKEIATGTVFPGKRVSVPVTVDVKDNYYFSVTTSNAAGESEPNGTHKFVGPDVPKAPTSFQTTINGNTLTLQWSSPSSTGVNGGPVNYSVAKYTVVRYPDKKVIVEDATSRTTTDELPSPEERTDYYYVLSTNVEGLQAPDVKSATISLGTILPPFTAEFTTATSVAGWTILDVDGDDNKWKYNSYNKALQLYGSYKGFDDWAITPAIQVKAGTSYPVTLTFTTSSYYDETVEVKWGTAPTVEAMTNTLVEATTFKNNSTTAPTELKGEIAATEAGKIYIGIHGCTEGKSNTINLISVNIESGQTGAAPAAVSDLKVSTPVDGTREATITFVVPSVNLAGETLEGDDVVSKIEILRDGNVITTLTEDIKGGEVVTYVDKAEDLTLGNHTYTVIPYNIHGDGQMAMAEVLVGARKPIAPESAKFIEEGNTGKVTISWDAVTTDFEGNTISADAVTYRVIDRQYNTLAEGLTTTSLSVQAVPEGEQAFCQFAVYAVTAGGESDKMAATAYKPVGKPYATPWAESFADGSVSHIFGYNFIKGNEPWQFKSSHEWGIVPQDNDGGFAYLECYGDLTALVSGKINLEGLNNPALTYYTYNYSSGNTYANALEVQVDNGDGSGFVPVQLNVVAETGPTNEWNKVIVDLSEYDGQTVILRIEPKNPGLSLYTLDNLRVSSYVEHNLTIANIYAPNVADINKPFEVTAVVSNTGVEPISRYTVELFKNGEFASYVDCSRIEPAAIKEVVFELTPDILDGDFVTLQAVIVCDTDEVEEDNSSNEINVGVAAPVVPAVNDLSVKSGNGTVELIWSTPDMTKVAPVAVTETFDGAESWTSTVEGWKFVDQDKAPFGGINTPNYPCTGIQSWYVADQTWSGFPEEGVGRWAAHSGTKFLVSAYAQRGGSSVQSDDWAITPRLYGCAQVISFYAKSFDPAYLETFEVLASSTTTSLDDFKVVGSVHEVPYAWTQYRFMLPEGTRYAAIRSRSFDKYLLFIDDVTYIPAEGQAQELNLTGYHVYRNNVRITDSPVETPNYVDAKASVGRDYTYFVTAVYDKGESRPSNKVSTMVTTGINDLDNSQVTIQVVAGGVVVNNLTEGEVTVTTVDGRIVARAAAAPNVHVSLTSGIYVVKAGSAVAKVVVK